MVELSFIYHGWTVACLRFTYRLPSEGLKFTKPCPLKHWTQGTPVNVMCIVGGGKVRKWRYYKGHLDGPKWCTLLESDVCPAVAQQAEDIGQEPKSIFILRDNARQSHNSNAGKALEKQYKLNILQQPGLTDS